MKRDEELAFKSASDPPSEGKGHAPAMMCFEVLQPQMHDILWIKSRLHKGTTDGRSLELKVHKRISQRVDARSNKLTPVERTSSRLGANRQDAASSEEVTSPCEATSSIRVILI